MNSTHLALALTPMGSRISTVKVIDNHLGTNYSAIGMPIRYSNNGSIANSRSSGSANPLFRDYCPTCDRVRWTRADERRLCSRPCPDNASDTEILFHPSIDWFDRPSIKLQDIIDDDQTKWSPQYKRFSAGRRISNQQCRKKLEDRDSWEKEAERRRSEILDAKSITDQEPLDGFDRFVRYAIAFLAIGLILHTLFVS